MINNRSILFAYVLAGLAGCGSTPVEDHYYSLVLAAESAATKTNGSNVDRHLIIGPVQLPAYLNKRGLTLQTGANELQIANHHFWAEPLEEAISKVLVQEIATGVNEMTVDRDAGRWTSGGDCRVRIEFDRFHATDRSRVVNSGRYWISSTDASVKEEFEVILTLSVDGYGHAVEKLRGSLDVLAAQISSSIASSSACSGE